MDRHNVLVIDDEEIARISCRRVLETRGIGVTLAASGREGLEFLLHKPFDLVLVDLKMPGMDGVEVAHRINRFDPSIVTIIITGYATIESAVAVMKEGAYDYLPKPFTPDELVIVVERGLEKRRLDLESTALRLEKAAMERNFVTMVTHQLRSPLSAISQYADVLLSGMGGDLNENQKEMVERIRYRLEGLLELINDWLDMSRIQSGEILSRRQPVSLADCVRGALSTFDLSAKEKNILCEIDIPENFPSVRVDPLTFGELVGNLISNAIKYNREGGSVRIRAYEKKGWVVLEVEDTGPGIEEVEIPFVFEQFYRGKSPEIRQQTGTGLGLTIVERIIKAHGGKVEVRSTPGEGTVFSVYVST
ncbi:MAG: hybrid sensor histidine kinase/response regulator [Syntrophobacteraceae bacterium]